MPSPHVTPPLNELMLFRLFILCGTISLRVVFTIPYKDDVRVLIACIVSQPSVLADRQSGVEVLSDLIVTISIAVQLYKRRTGFVKTDQLITKLLL